MLGVISFKDFTLFGSFLRVDSFYSNEVGSEGTTSTVYLVGGHLRLEILTRLEHDDPGAALLWCPS